MNSPVLDLKAKGLLRIVKAKYTPASHIEVALYLSKSRYATARRYLLQCANFEEERHGKIVLREKDFNIFIYKH